MGSDRGSPAQRPAHTVSVADFEIMRTEITNAHYQACVEAGACSIAQQGGYYTYGLDEQNYPLNGVSWFQLNDFAQWVGARLPTEAEWEYAARGRGRNVRHPWGNEPPSCLYMVMDEGGNGCGQGFVSPVCSKPEGHTPQGLCDMAGNLLEWLQDEWHPNYEGSLTDAQLM